ncbi:MAG TPA: protein kinase [Kofleriaceae bacterium]|nr:protein kinase [Kofleriaceae bacterium]
MCPAPERLIEFVEGALDERSQAELESHIDVCDACRGGLAAALGKRGAEWTLGRYRVDSMLGSGGMGIVYRGWDPSLARPVAIKVVRDPTLRDRLAREAQTQAKLNHPNACQVYDVGTDGDEVWIAMELVRGVTLRAWLAGARTRDEVLAVLLGAGRGLGAAHAAGLVHRDVKPENVLVEDTGRAVVTDFGLARSLDGTRTSVLAGTPAYMAPEQLDGQPADARSDQYAFAVMAHEALAGTRPRAGVAPRVVLPPAMRAALERALSDDPAARFPALDQLLEALVVRPRRRWPAVLGLGAIAVAAVGVVAEWPTEPPVAPPSASEPPAPVVVAAAPSDAAIAPPSDAAPVPRATVRRRPDAGVARVAVAAPRDAAAIAIDARDDSVPRFGSTASAKNLRAKLTTTLAHAESIFGSGYCVMPGGPVAGRWSGPVDWGKVTRVADVVALHGSARMDAHLVEIAGQKRRYVINAYWGSAINGNLDAAVGDTVALCVQNDDDRWQLPGDWTGPVTNTKVAVRVGGPPDYHGLHLVSSSELVATSSDQRWPFDARVLVYDRGTKLESGAYGMSGWRLEIDAHTAHAFDPHRGAWIVVEAPHWESLSPGRETLFLHAAEMREHVFPEP